MVIGIDNDACMVALAARTCREPAFQEADVRSMKETFRKHDLSLLFDIVFSNFALHGLADAANHRRALQNIRDMMSPGGIAVISFLDSKGFGEFHEAAHLVSQRAEWSGKFTTRSSRDFLSFDTFKSLALREGFRGEVTRTETWVSFEDAAELKGCFMTLWRNYMSCLPDQTQQEAFADAVVNYYQTIVRNINDYPSERGGLSIRQSTIDAHLLHGTFTNS
jgi:trans-aconitate methyltransferase